MPRTWRRCSTSGWGLTLAAVVLLVGASGAVAGESADAARRRARDVTDGAYQGELPADRSGSYKGATPRTGRRSASRGVRIPGASAIGAVGMLMFYVIVAVVVGLVAWWIIAEFGRRQRRDGEGGDVAQAEEAPHLPLELRDPGQLAAEGRFDEAIHQLLLHAIKHLCLRDNVMPPPSLTTRELRSAFRLSDAGNEAFAEITSAVELSLFGGRPAVAQSYARCRASYEVVTRA